MERLSEFISKKIVSMEEGVCVGYILNTSIDIHTISPDGFLVCDESEEKIKFLDYKNIIANGEYIIIKNSNMLSFGENLENKSLIGREIISTDGISLGLINDILVNKNKIIKLLTNKAEINPSYISIWGENYLIFSEKKIRNKKNRRFQRLDNKIIQKVEIQNKLNNNQILPYKANINSQKIIGKIAICDIFGFNNELIIRKNEIINERIINIAKKHNKLNHLIVNSK